MPISINALYSSAEPFLTDAICFIRRIVRCTLGLFRSRSSFCRDNPGPSAVERLLRSVWPAFDRALAGMCVRFTRIRDNQQSRSSQASSSCRACGTSQRACFVRCTITEQSSPPMCETFRSYSLLLLPVVFLENTERPQDPWMEKWRIRQRGGLLRDVGKCRLPSRSRHSK